MKKSIKKISILALSIISALCITMFAVNVGNVKADEEQAPVTLTMVKGASVRIGEGYESLGVRFQMQAPKSQIDALESDESVSNINYGMVIAPKQYYNKYAFNQQNLFGESAIYCWGGKQEGKYEILHVTPSRQADESDTYYQYNGSVINFKPNNIAYEYVARGYISYTQEEQTKYVFANYENDNYLNTCRSMYYVAQMAYNVGKELTNEQKTLIKNCYINNEAITVEKADLFNSFVSGVKTIEDKNSADFLTVLNKIKSEYNGLVDYEQNLDEVVSDIFEGYVLNEEALFDLSNVYGASAITTPNKNDVSDTNHSIVPFDKFEGQTSALKVTCNTVGLDTSLRIKFSNLFTTVTPKDCVNGIRFMIYSNGRYTTVKNDPENWVNYGGVAMSTTSYGANVVATVTINGTELAKYNSWDEVMIKIRCNSWNNINDPRLEFYLSNVYDRTKDFNNLVEQTKCIEDKNSTQFRTALNEVKATYNTLNNYERTLEQVLAEIFEDCTLDQNSLFDLSSAYGISGVNIYSDSRTAYAGGTRTNAYNYTVETTDTFNAVTGQTSAIKFTKPAATNHALIIRLSDMFGASGTKPSDYDGLVFYMKSNFDTKGYEYARLQLDFVALNAVNGAESGWRQRVGDSNNGKVVKVTIDKAQLERWGDNWDNAAIWILLVTGGRWDLGLASNDFYLYLSNIQGYTVDNSKLFDLSNPLGTSALTIYDENMTSYRKGSSKRLANNYLFEKTNVFEDVTGQTSAIKFVKPLNGSDTSPLIKLSSMFGASGTKPSDYQSLTFYIMSNFDTKGYAYSTLQLDFVALMSSDGSESGWRQRVSNNSNIGQVVEITIDRAQLERWGDSWDNAMIWILFVTGGRWDLGLASNDFYLYVSSITGTLNA